MYLATRNTQRGVVAADGLVVRQLQIFVVIHKLGHGSSSFGCDAPTRRWSLALRIEENYTF